MAHTATDDRTTPSPGGDPTRGRWLLVGAALLLQFSIGAVYAWSVFSTQLTKPESFGYTKPEAALPFEVAIGMIFIGAYIGGRIQAAGARARSLSSAASSTASASSWPASPTTPASSGCWSSATASSPG